MIQTFDLVRLTFTEPLHIGNPEGDYTKGEESVRSDTMVAAIMQMWALSGNSSWISDKPGFVISSLFPFVSNEGNYHYLFPKPVGDSITGANNFVLNKALKRVRYYDQHYFEKRLSGRLESVKQEHIAGDILTVNGTLFGGGYCENVVTTRRLRPEREGEAGEIYYFERRYFRPGAGLYLLVSFQEEEVRRRFFSALELLSISGIGSDRSSGNGRFTFAADTLELELPDEASHGINLSLFCPSSESVLNEMLTSETRYALIRRGGWLGEPYTTLRKRSVYMFTEGSLFSLKEKGVSVHGKYADLRPVTDKVAHPVYRSGEALFLPVNI
jgi:CRISPR-associated protein Csm4